MEEFDKDFNGDLGTALKEMIHNDTDCCEVKYTLGDMQITAEILITKVVVADEVVYDAEDVEETDVEYDEDQDQLTINHKGLVS
jgi:hypothetical protein